MRKLVFITIVCAFVTVPALADPAKIKTADGPGGGNGGAFWATVTKNSISYVGDAGNKIGRAHV